MLSDLDFAALLVSRVCHDLVSPVGAVVNGLEVLEEERDPGLRADALRLVTSSAAQAAARLQFARIAYGAAGSAGAELDLNEVGRMVCGLLKGGKVEVSWEAPAVNWPKDWAKLLMNASVLAADSLQRGGRMRIATAAAATAPGFTITAEGQGARVLDEVAKAFRGETDVLLDGRSVQAFLTYRLARLLDTQLALSCREGLVEITAG